MVFYLVSKFKSCLDLSHCVPLAIDEIFSITVYDFGGFGNLHVAAAMFAISPLPD
jgi:hypothetical protein